MPRRIDGETVGDVLTGRAALSRRGFVRVLGGATLAGALALVEACSPSAPQAAPTTAPAPKPTTAPAATTSPTAPASAPSAAPSAAASASPAAAAASPQPATAAGNTSGTTPGGLKLPNRFPLASLKPDLPGSDDGLIDPGFINYPANPIKSVADTPGSGGDVTVMTWTTGAPPTPMESNQLWQAVNKELGVNLKISVQAQSDYATVKLPTTIASGDLPDILFISPAPVVPSFPEFLKSQMTDLTPYLSGDAVKDYPNLATFPDIAWRNVVYNNAIYGVPVPYPLFLWVHWVHQELMDADGLQPPKNSADFKQLAQHFTKPDQNLYGVGLENNVGMGTTNGYFDGMFSVPNLWSLDDKSGKLTAAWETDQLRQAVSYVRDLWSAGVITPKALDYNLVSARNDFAARRFAFRFDGFQSASVTFWQAAPSLDPPGKPRIVSPFPAQDGGKPTYWANSGYLGFSAIKKTSTDRVKELLRVLNWLAAPLGSQEYLLMNYGVQGVHWTPDAKGNPVLNDKGKTDSTVPWRYITQAPVSLYYPADPAYAGILQDAEKAMLPFAVSDPTLGYYSPTGASKTGALTRGISDGVNDIVVGRQPLTYLDQVISDWRNNGGETVRTEYQQAIASAKS